MSGLARIRAMNRSFLLLLALAFIADLKPAFAIDMRAGREISVASGEVVAENLYVATTTLFISGRVDGDLTAACSRAFIDGTVTRDVALGAGSIQMNGHVGGDFRVAGGQVVLAGKIDGDLVIAGGTVRLLPAGYVAGDVILAGGTLTVDGGMARSLKAVAGEIVLNGAVAGPVEVRTSSLTVGDNARLSDVLTYFSPEEARISKTAVVKGPITFHVISGMDQDWFRVILGRLGVAFLFIRFLMTLGAGLLGYFLLPKPSQALVSYALDNFGREFARGFLLFFIFPPAIFLIFITVIGAPVAFLGGLTLLIVGIVSIIYSGIALGTLLLKHFRHQRQYQVSWAAVLIGIPLAFLVRLVPYAGFLFNAVFFLAVFGALYKRFWVILRGEPDEKPPQALYE